MEKMNREKVCAPSFTSTVPGVINWNWLAGDWGWTNASCSSCGASLICGTNGCMRQIGHFEWLEKRIRDQGYQWLLVREPTCRVCFRRQVGKLYVFITGISNQPWWVTRCCTKWSLKGSSQCSYAVLRRSHSMVLPCKWMSTQAFPVSHIPALFRAIKHCGRGVDAFLLIIHLCSLWGTCVAEKRDPLHCQSWKDRSQTLTAGSFFAGDE